jgi:hypothetical protein
VKESAVMSLGRDRRRGKREILRKINHFFWLLISFEFEGMENLCLLQIKPSRRLR